METELKGMLLEMELINIEQQILILQMLTHR